MPANKLTQMIMKIFIAFFFCWLTAFSSNAQSTSSAPLQLSMRVLFSGSVIPEGAFVPGPVQFFIHPDLTTTLPVHKGDTITLDFMADGNKLTTAKAVWHDAQTPPVLPGQVRPMYLVPAQFIVPNYNWTNVPVGSHVLSIQAYGFHGLSASALLHVTVLPPLPKGPISGTHTVTGKIRSAIKPEQVGLIHVFPYGTYEVIGTVSAQAPGTKSQDEQEALAELKKQAAQMGANWIVLDPPRRSEGAPYSTQDRMFVAPEIYVSGKAIYQPPSVEQ
jgi:uncharacterized protein YbjQ (UPF0145 family)